eukprot:8904723-Pyramimonas_sp.AAC.1
MAYCLGVFDSGCAREGLEGGPALTRALVVAPAELVLRRNVSPECYNYLVVAAREYSSTIGVETVSRGDDGCPRMTHPRAVVGTGVVSRGSWKTSV